MMTTLKPGTPFIMRERGEYRLWRVADDPNGYTGVGRPLKPGETIHFCVWKGDKLESRKSYVLKPADVEWVSSGMLHWDKQPRSTSAEMVEVMNFMNNLLSGKPVTFPGGRPKPPQLPETEENFIFVNRFNEDSKAPVWVRDAR